MLQWYDGDDICLKITNQLRETTQTILSNDECMTKEGEIDGNTQSMAGRWG